MDGRPRRQRRPACGRSPTRPPNRGTWGQAFTAPTHGRNRTRASRPQPSPCDGYLEERQVGADYMPRRSRAAPHPAVARDRRTLRRHPPARYGDATSVRWVNRPALGPTSPRATSRPTPELPRHTRRRSSRSPSVWRARRQVPASTTSTARRDHRRQGYAALSESSSMTGSPPRSPPTTTYPTCRRRPGRAIRLAIGALGADGYNGNLAVIAATRLPAVAPRPA